MIGVDIDGVLVDFDRGWVNRWNNLDHDGPFVPVAAPQMWEWMHRLAGLPSPEAWWEWFETSGGFWGLPYYPGAMDALQVLIRHREVVLVSSRPGYGRGPVYEMVERFRLDEHLQGVLFTKDKTKAPIDTLIEDRPLTIQLSVHCFDVVRVDRPWNQPGDYPELGGCRTVGSLVQYVEEELELEKHTDSDRLIARQIWNRLTSDEPTE